MTKEITKANILQEIQDKLKLREFEPTPFIFSEMVVPTYNIEEHLEKPSVDYTEVSITGTGGFLFFTVPDTERWKLHAYNVVFLAAGAYKVTGLYIRRVAASAMYYDMVEGQTVSYAKVLPAPVRLDPGNEIKLFIDTYTSTADLRLYIDVTKENIR